MKQFLSILMIITLFSCKENEKRTEPLSERTQPMITAPDYEAVSLLGDTLYSQPPSEELIARYNERKIAFDANPDNIENIIWHGRFTAYLGKYHDAIDIFSKGIEKYPEDPRLYRHRGHRYISIRKFQAAIDDLTKAAQLIKDTEDETEPDGMPNERNIPVSTLHGNIYYHLGLAHYLKHDMNSALEAYKKCLKTADSPDNVVSATHWIYMILRRQGREAEAKKYLEPITEKMDVIENTAYHRACLFYKGELELNEINAGIDPDSPSSSALNYAIGNWLYYTGEELRAKVIFEEIVKKDDWASFGYIATESDLTKLF